MKSSDKEKYLGDYINTAGSTKDTLAARISRGNAIYAEMKSLLNEIPLGTKRTEIGLALREAWFLNGCLFNSEVWCNSSPQDMQKLETIDNKILRHILGAHEKAPVEFLHLETGTLNILSVISVRRMCYLQNILKRHDSELVKRVYNELKDSSVKGDWYSLVKQDFEFINEIIDEERIKENSENQHKREIKEKVRKQTFKLFNEQKEKHSKVKDIVYSDLIKAQSYLCSAKLSNKQTAMLVNLRSRCVRGFKKNFSTAFTGNLMCPLCQQTEDTQEHALSCHIIEEHRNQSDKLVSSNVRYNNIYGTVEEQLNIANVFLSAVHTRERLLEQQEPADQGIMLDPPTGDIYTMYTSNGK